MHVCNHLQRVTPTWGLVLLFFAFSLSAFAQNRVLEKNRVHLRSGTRQEWAGFSSQVPRKSYLLTFRGNRNDQPQTLQIRQADIKQPWQVLLNSTVLGRLHVDEKDLQLYLSIPEGLLTTGKNELRIEPLDTIPDDILVGAISLYPATVSSLLSASEVQLQVIDKETHQPVPSRLTIVNEYGSLQAVGATSNDTLVARTGFIYTATGKASFGLPAGRYTIYATRGFAYGVDSIKGDAGRGQRIEKTLRIRKEVDTKGWGGSDTHLHTLTYSGHGDATMKERLLTIAGEGIDLPVITEHNRVVDVTALTDSMGLASFFTPVTGMELTTAVGHFNLFPLSASSTIPRSSLQNWRELDSAVKAACANCAIILNHARDIHNGFRPFGPQRHVSASGRALDGWPLPANAMEVINSGSQQSARMQLILDWFGMLNRGHYLAPAGSSDSHDVGRYLAGQSRTYIRSAGTGRDTALMNATFRNFREGKVLVSFGLMTKIDVEGQGPGELVPYKDSISVSVQVLGPGWTSADKVILYANGQRVGERPIVRGQRPGLKWEGTWKLTGLRQDVFLTAYAEGPGTYLPYWAIAKPYQPASEKWDPKVMGLSGAVWVDGDRDGQRTSAYEYAKQVVEKSGSDISALVQLLTPYDEAVKIQALSLLQEKGNILDADGLQRAYQRKGAKTKQPFRVGIIK